MKRIARVLVFLIVLTACGPSPEAIASMTATAATATAASWTLTPTPSLTPTETPTPTLTFTPTQTLTPTITPTPSITPVPTYDFPDVTVNKQAHCRFGPSVAYLHAADLYPGDTGTVRGRFEYSRWLYVKFDKLDYFCWVAPSVVDVVGDISLIYETKVVLPKSALYQPPNNVVATRSGDIVSISWDPVVMTGDKYRGYFIEGFVCQGGFYIWYTDFTPETTIQVKDEAGCPVASEMDIRAVEKHGYTTPVTIAWPQP
jgi:hypothetical protein